MNKRILHISLFLMLASTGNVLAQQGIGTNTPHRSAALQIDSQNKGLLIPRMNLGYNTSTNKITAPTITSPLNATVKGLLVYNQTSVSDGTKVVVPEGFYYYDGSEWNPISKSYLQDSDHTTISGNGTSSNPYTVNIKPSESFDTQKVLATNTSGQIVWVEQGANTDTTYTGGDGIKLEGTEFSVPVTTEGTGNVITNVVHTADGITVTKGDLIDTNTTYTGGDGIKLEGTEFSVPVTTEGTGNVITNVVHTADGITVTKGDLIDTNTTYTGGEGIKLEGTEFSVPVTTEGTGNVITNVVHTADGITVTKSQIAITDTTYTGGEGIKLEGTEFSVPVTTEGTGNVITNVVHTANGITVTKSQIAITDTTYTGGEGIKLEGTEFSVPVTTQGTGNVITNVVHTADGITVTKGDLIDTNTTYTGGDGIKLEGTEFSVPVTTEGTGNVITNVIHTADGITVTKSDLIDTNTTYTADNGVKIVNDVVKLGGNLTENTVITTSSNDFTIAATQAGTTGKLKISGLENTKQVSNSINNSTLQTTINKVLVVDANNTVKTANAVMPEFFYMPSIVINTAQTSVNLYQQYLNQFGNPMISNTDNEGALPVLLSTMLDYHVTYYDSNVLTNVSINNNGLMNYTVSTAPTNMTFINVVFKVRSTPNIVNP